MENRKQMPLWRCEFEHSSDKNLVAKFFRAETAQEALEKAKQWHGSPVKIVVTLEKE